MASEADIDDAEKRINDNVLIEQELIDLASIVAGSGGITLIIARDGIQFDLTGLAAKLTAGSQDETDFIAAVEAIVLAMIGPTEVVIGTLRKEARDFVTANDVDIAAT